MGEKRFFKIAFRTNRQNQTHSFGIEYDENFRAIADDTRIQTSSFKWWIERILVGMGNRELPYLFSIWRCSAFDINYSDYH